MENEIKEYSEGLWYYLDKNIVTVGVTEEALNEIEMIYNFLMVDVGDQIEADHMIGELNSKDDSINLYSPVSGEIIEINEMISENPRLIYEDPTGESWLFKVECDDEEELEALTEEKEEIEV